ncbi:MAG: hypothetical protein HY367_03675 [Candidatus Aenigmarchaeota archaeon]|nr:hypothetical protein [Candidatus Aenigmarchaeota archaeon]
MALLRNIKLGEDEILVTLKLAKKEFEKITPGSREFIVLPTSGLDRTLVTGKIGNGNRIMVPNKFLRRHSIEILRKNVPGKIIDMDEGKFLVIELEKKRIKVPVFSD